MIRRGLANHAARLVALALAFALYGFARLPSISQEERSTLASRFAFTRTALPVPAGLVPHFSRHVSPDMQPIAGWISSVGAAVAIHDLDGNGLDDDACWVDPRYDQVLVAPLPGTGERFPMFALDPAPLPYDARTTAPMGCLPGDFNEDGLTDLLVYYWGRPPILFLRRGGAAGAGAPRREAYRATEIADPAERWYTNALTSADVDGDGHLDLVVGNYFQDGARILDDRATSGEEMQRSMSHAPNGGRNRLLLFAGATAGDRPSVRFADVPDAFDRQTTYSWTLAIGAADLDGDMRPELYFANDFGNDRLLHNLSTPGHPRFAVLHGERTLATPRSKILGRDSFKGMGVDFADLNGDGRLDIYVSNIAQDYALEENHFVWVSTGETRRMREGVAPYVDRSEPLGLARSAWSWDARFVDFDDDGVPEAVQATGFVHGETNRWPELQELAMGNDNLLHVLGCWPFFRPTDDLSGRAHDPFFVRAASGRYFDVAPELGFGMNQVSRGLAVADVDGDGRLDLAVANQWGDSYFYRNVSPHPGAFLGLDLRLPVSTGLDGPGARAGRPAVGAEAVVHLPDGRRLVAQVDGGSGHSGKRAPILHFGLGRLDPRTPLPVDVRWRGPHGDLYHHTFELRPGWHRLMLDGNPLDAKGSRGKAV